MRTKVLICAAVLGASLVSTMAQVYSLNVVGYVNQTVEAGKWYLFGNPLSAGAVNSSTVLSNLNSAAGLSDWGNHTTPADPGSTVYSYNQPGGISGGYGSPDQFFYDPPDSFIGWFEGGNVDLRPGNGFWFFSTGTGTITFVGEVQTTNTFALVPGWNLISSAFPASLDITTLGLQGSAPLGPNGGDFIYRWNLAPNYVNAFDNGIQYFNDPADSFIGWFSGDAGDTSGLEGPVLKVGEGIWYNKTGSSVTWTKSFTIN